MEKKKPFSEIPHIYGNGVELRAIGRESAEGLRALTGDEAVYRYLPTFLFEKKYDAETVIDRLYDECLKESLFLGIYKDGAFCGIIELYGRRDEIRKISVGYRLRPAYWGQGIASEALRLMIDYLYTGTDIEIVTASTMIENAASAKVLQKNGFTQVVHAVYEDWGFDAPVLTDKWIR